jgi:hypothetical protein
VCARCGGRRCWLISTRPERRRCASCRSEVSLRSGTLLADSRVPLGVESLECSPEEPPGVWGVERSEGGGGNWGGPPRPGGLLPSERRAL